MKKLNHGRMTLSVKPQPKINPAPNTARIDAAIEPLSRYFNIKLIGYNDEDGFIFSFKPKEVVDKADETC